MEHQGKAQPNRDPISGAPGAHPFGTGVGAAVGGAAAGAATGTVAGPVGTAIGAAVGAVLGGLGGKAVAEHYDPTLVDEYWRNRYEKEPYYQSGARYEDYAPAYHLGAAARDRFPDQDFSTSERELESRYEDIRGTSKLDWKDVRRASEAAWAAKYL